MPAVKQLAKAFADQYIGYQLAKGWLRSNKLDAKWAAQCRNERAVRPLGLKEQARSTSKKLYVGSNPKLVRNDEPMRRLSCARAHGF